MRNSMLTINGNKELDRLMRSMDVLSQSIIPKSTSQAINKTLDSVKSKAKTLVANEVGMLYYYYTK